MPALTWDEICADPSLADLPYKIETNEDGHIVMHPAPFWHSLRQGRIAAKIARLRQDGDVSTETAIQTTKGVKATDVAWVSDAFSAKHRDESALSAAPELCVEVLSDSNTKREIMEKMTLYFALGALEVWLCDDAGKMTFHTSPEQTVAHSGLIPGFPEQV